MKSVVLRSDGSQSIGAVGASLLHVVGTKGMNGVGKSCALRRLAKDPDIHQPFQEGVYYIILGKDTTTETDVVEQVAKVIEASGGIQTARRVRKEEDIDTAVSKAKKWFPGRRVVLLIDDVGSENDVGRDVVGLLSRIVDTEQGSRVHDA